MKKLNKKELNNINGGAVSGALLGYIVKAATLIFDLGKSLGSAIRRATTGNYC